MAEQSIREELAQVIANSFFGMEVGYMPTESHELPTPSSGDLQLAFDVLASPVIRRIQAEAWFEGADAAVHGYDLPDASQIHNPYIERGETA